MSSSHISERSVLRLLSCLFYLFSFSKCYPESYGNSCCGYTVIYSFSDVAFYFLLLHILAKHSELVEATRIISYSWQQLNQSQSTGVLQKEYRQIFTNCCCMFKVLNLVTKRLCWFFITQTIFEFSSFMMNMTHIPYYQTWLLDCFLFQLPMIRRQDYHSVRSPSPLWK